MSKFIPREKLGKKARRALDAEKRAIWSFSPVTRKVENKKRYDRKKSAHAWKDDFGMSAFCLPRDTSAMGPFACSAVISASLTGPVSAPSHLRGAGRAFRQTAREKNGKRRCA